MCNHKRHLTIASNPDFVQKPLFRRRPAQQRLFIVAYQQDLQGIATAETEKEKIKNETGNQPQ